MSRRPGVLTLTASLSGILLLGSGTASAETYILPSSAFRAGAGGAEYRTDVRIINQASVAAVVTAYFYDQVTSTTWQANSFRIEARNQAAFDNILQSLFGRTLSQGAYGPIRFEASGPLLVGASVNNVNACGSGAVSGQWLPGILTSQSLKSGVIGQLAVSSSGSSGYRTNLVFVNGGSSAATATVKLRRGGGGLLSTATIGPLSANGFRQVALDAATFAGVGGTTDTNLWLEFTSDQPLIAYATIIHNVSGDPFAVVASADVPAPVPQEVTFTLPGGVPLVMVRIPAGTFQMGASEDVRGSYAGQRPEHQVTLSQDFYIGKYEVTQNQWLAVMGWNPTSSAACGGNCPVDQVAWESIRATDGFIVKLNQLLGTTGFRLPTEAEWERAARGGTQTRFSFGDALNGDDFCKANEEAEPYVWWCQNGEGELHPVGTKRANPYGLYDMHGSVSERVEDLYGDYSSTPQTDPVGPTSGLGHVVRGGDSTTGLIDCTSASRGSTQPYNAGKQIGFRLAMSVSSSAAAVTITSDSPDPSTVGQAVAVSVTVSGSGPTPTGSVMVTSTDTTGCQVTLASGTGSCNLTFTASGSKTITAAYLGDGSYAGGVQSTAFHSVNSSLPTVGITSDSPDPSLVGQAVAVSVTVSGSGPTPTGSVMVTSADSTGCQMTLASGTGSCNLTFTASGSKTIMATYLGDASYASGAQSTTSHVVSPELPSEVTFTLPGGAPLIMVRIPAGTFLMGAPETERGSYSDERPVHQVTLTSDYYIGKYEVTQAQWQAVMGTNPSYFAACGGNCPVESVSWYDIEGTGGFTSRLNQLMGTTKFRLPTEAEWERAARGGTQTRFSFGDALAGDDGCGANAEASPYIWWCANAGNSTHPVGTKGANQYGLYDMHGNVSEWVEDWYGAYSSPSQSNPTGPLTGTHRALRGGNWGVGLGNGRSAERTGQPPDSHGPGLRLAMLP